MNAQGEAETEYDVTLSEPAVVPQEPTLHDFVVNLLNDATARAAFAQDPTGMLDVAGLGGITPQDVQDVVPLVMDRVGAEPEDGVLNGVDDVIEQLRGVAQTQEGRADLSEVTEATDLDSVVGGVTAGGSATLDDVTGVLRYDTGAVTGETAGQLDDNGLNLGSYTDTLAARASGVGGVGLDSSGGMASVDSVVGAADGMLDADADGVSGVGGVSADRLDAGVFGDVAEDSVVGGAGLRSDVVSGEGSALLTEDGYAAGGTLETPFGAYGVEVSDELSVSVPEVTTKGDVVDSLDADTLTRGSEAAASTVATYVTSGGAALPGTVRDAAEDLSGDLPVNVPADLPLGGPQTLPVDGAADLANASTLDDQVLSQPRDLGLDIDEPIQVVDLDTDLPELAGPVYDLASDLHRDLNSLPDQLGFAVPAEKPEMPDLPVLNPMPESADDRGAAGSAVGTENLDDVTRVAEPVSSGVDQVADTVSGSPLGGVAEQGEDLLSGGAGLNDLDLGH
ncbi:IniB N-terminal domain-containing protein [Saccharomonospora azurea]|uniref:Uncharacterized protein n=1 Tax=Saccharomonospora azurea NA-128 TaxID=882081 RepID=H8G7G0_9PSEU|nr:IniB N-terminal domain-containing protein [Saccharomonospora azurea]EHY89355.1 hypothetical protein SacazDRAFT_02452 [Saccharomonospora azurea NA-128]